MKWKIPTWSVKVQPLSVKRFGTEEDKGEVDCQPTTYRNQSRNGGTKQKRSSSPSHGILYPLRQAKANKASHVAADSRCQQDQQEG